jgi:hypothetical protein
VLCTLWVLKEKEVHYQVVFARVQLVPISRELMATISPGLPRLCRIAALAGPMNTLFYFSMHTSGQRFGVASASSCGNRVTG